MRLPKAISKRFKIIYKTYFKLVVIAFFSMTNIGCSDDNETPNFIDDSNLRLKSLISYTKTNPDQKFTYFFQYDANNRLIRIEGNSLGATLDFIYDNQGRLTHVGDYEYYYNGEGKVHKIKNENLAVFFGTYDSTMVNYDNGKISTLSESFTNDSAQRTSFTNISYNNREQVRLAVTTSSTFNFESGQEYVNQKDKETYTFNSHDNIDRVISERDFDSPDYLEIEKTYAFDNFNNPIQLLLKSTGIHENISVINLRPLGFKNSLSWYNYLHYYTNNLVSYTSIPQTNDDGFVQYRFKTTYSYNEYGYPISAEETQTLVNRNKEIIKFFYWEYEEY